MSNIKVSEFYRTFGGLTQSTEHFMKAYYVSKRATGRVLDIGCNTGFLSALLDKTKVTSYTGLEISDEVIKHKVVDANVIWCDITKVPWPLDESSFDTVVWLEGPDVFIDPVPIYQELTRVLKSGGLLIIATPKFIRYLSPEFPRMYEYGLEEIANELKDQHFQVVNVQEVSASETRLWRKLFLVDAVAPGKYDSKYWDERAKGEFGIVGGNITKETYEAETKKQIEVLKKVVDWSKLTVLDAGCGDGRLTKDLKPLCKSITGCDFSMAWLRRAAVNVQDVDFIPAKLGTNLPFKDDEFDVSLAWYVLIHVVSRDEWNKSLDELKRISGQHIIIGEVVRENWGNQPVAPHCVIRSIKDYEAKMSPWKLGGTWKTDNAMPITVMRFDRNE